jgi:hypothetical protein
MEYKLGKLQQTLVDLKQRDSLVSANNVYEKQRIVGEIDKVKREINQLNATLVNAKKFDEVRHETVRDKSRDLNPSINIAVTVYVDGTKLKVMKDEIVTFDKRGDLVVSHNIEPNERKMSQLKADIIDTRRRLDDVLDDLSVSTNKFEAKSNYLYLKRKMDELKKQREVVYFQQTTPTGISEGGYVVPIDIAKPVHHTSRVRY